MTQILNPIAQTRFFDLLQTFLRHAQQSHARHLNVTLNGHTLTFKDDGEGLSDGKLWPLEFLEDFGRDWGRGPLPLKALTFRSRDWESTLTVPEHTTTHKEGLATIKGYWVKVHLTPPSGGAFLDEQDLQNWLQRLALHHTFTLTLNGNPIPRAERVTYRVPHGKIHLCPHDDRNGVVDEHALHHNLKVQNTLSGAFPDRASFGYRLIREMRPVGVHFEPDSFLVGETGLEAREAKVKLQEMVQGLLESLKSEVALLIEQHPGTPLLELPVQMPDRALPLVLEELGYRNVVENAFLGWQLADDPSMGLMPAQCRPIRWAGHPVEVEAYSMVNILNALFLRGLLPVPATQSKDGCLPEFHPQLSTQDRLVEQVEEITFGGHPLKDVVMHTHLNDSKLKRPLLVTTRSSEELFLFLTSGLPEADDLIGEIASALVDTGQFAHLPVEEKQQKSQRKAWVVEQLMWDAADHLVPHVWRWEQTENLILHLPTLHPAGYSRLGEAARRLIEEHQERTETLKAQLRELARNTQDI